MIVVDSYIIFYTPLPSTRIIQPHIFMRVPAFNPAITQARIFISFEFVHGIIHQGGIEQIKRAKQLKILNIQASNFFEKPWFKLGDDVFQAIFAVIAQVHEDWDPGGEFYQFFLNFLAFGLEFLLFLGQFFLFVWL